MNNILVIGDSHIPFEHKHYLQFCLDTKKKYKCKDIIHIGDVTDNHKISFHDSNNENYSSGQEVKKAIKRLKKWTKAFPKVKVCIGNHDELARRRCLRHGMSNRYIKNYNDIWELPESWQWDFKHKLGNVLFVHGTGQSGKYPHIRLAEMNRCNTVMGHCHSVCGVQHMASFHDKIWGMCVGSGVDNKAYCFAYGRVYPRKPFISCGVILEGGKVPMIVPMDI